MVTYVEKRLYSWMPENVQKFICQIACLSTDTKPTENIVTGSTAIEVDTGNFYLFDESSSTWTLMCSIKE